MSGGRRLATWAVITGSAVILAAAFFFIYETTLGRGGPAARDVDVLLVYNPALTGRYGYAVAAFESVLEEQGVPFRAAPPSVFFSMTPSGPLVKRLPAVIFPDGVDAHLPAYTSIWIKKYLESGGSVLLTYDPGVKNPDGTYAGTAMFAPLLGVDYGTYARLGAGAYTKGYLKIDDPGFLEIPPGKYNGETGFIEGYRYGRLVYPVARVEVQSKDYRELAEALIPNGTPGGTRIPAVLIKTYGKGRLYYAGVPLGYLKAYASDGMLLEAVLRSFLFKTAAVPHLAGTPFAEGVLVLNWHVEANDDWKALDYMIAHGYLRKGIRDTFDVTAGGFEDKPGDNAGFDACGAGRKYVRTIMEYGSIGSDGGWAHNWFVTNMLAHRFGTREVRALIEKNDDCLESITGYKVLDYMPCSGIFRQPDDTRILEGLGMIAYYGTGDTGASPNRAFADGKMVSGKVIEFPVSTYNGVASLYEMDKAGIPATDAARWLKGMVDYVIRNRTARLVYFHPHDIFVYPDDDPVIRLIDYADTRVKAGTFEVLTMRGVAAFMLRLLDTRYAFHRSGHGLSVELYNARGLEGIAVAIPKRDGCAIEPAGTISMQEGARYSYVSIHENVDHMELDFSCPD